MFKGGSNGSGRCRRNVTSCEDHTNAGAKGRARSAISRSLVEKPVAYAVLSTRLIFWVTPLVVGHDRTAVSVVAASAWAPRRRPGGSAPWTPTARPGACSAWPGPRRAPAIDRTTFDHPALGTRSPCGDTRARTRSGIKLLRVSRHVAIPGFQHDFNAWSVRKTRKFRVYISPQACSELD